MRLEDCLRNGDIVFVRSNGNKELVGRCMLVKIQPSELHILDFVFVRD